MTMIINLYIIQKIKDIEVRVSNIILNRNFHCELILSLRFRNWQGYLIKEFKVNQFINL